MDFDLNDEQKLLRDTTRELLDRSYDLEQLTAAQETPRGWRDDVWRRLAETGLLGLGFDEDDGGSGAGPVEVGIVMTELGRRLAPEPVLDAVLLPGSLIADVGSEAQRRKILPDAVGGAILLAFAHAEPGQRVPTTAVRTTAVRQGDSWTVSGTKNPVPHGDCADTVVVSAQLPDGAIGLFLVDAGTRACPGSRTRPTTGAAVHRSNCTMRRRNRWEAVTMRWPRSVRRRCARRWRCVRRPWARWRRRYA